MHVDLTPNVLALVTIQSVIQSLLIQGLSKRTRDKVLDKLDLKRDQMKAEELETHDGILNCGGDDQIHDEGSEFHDQGIFSDGNFDCDPQLPTSSTPDFPAALSAETLGSFRHEQLQVAEAGVLMPLNRVALAIGRAVNFEYAAMKIGPTSKKTNYNFTVEEITRMGDSDSNLYDWTSVSD